MSIGVPKRAGWLASAMQALGLGYQPGDFRDPTLWQQQGVGYGRKTASSEWVNEDSALTYSACWAATRLLCGTGGSLPFPLYQGLEDERRTKARTHPVYRVLNGMWNPEQTAAAARSLMWQWQVNSGNAYAEIVREGDRPDGAVIALWPLAPWRVRMERDDSGSLYYTVLNEETRKWDELEPERMLHIPSVITMDGITGKGVIAHARESIGAGLAMVKYGANWFGDNGGVPRVVVEHSGKWDDTQRSAFRKEWAEVHSGPEGSKIAVLGGGAKANPLTISAEDSQFLETQQHTVEEIARWYGVPPHMLQHLLRATFNNVENLGIEFVQYSLIPWLRVWEQCVWQKLLTPDEKLEYFAEHNVDALLRGDAASRSAFYHQAINDGWMNRNEVRKKENLDPVDGGEVFLVQGAMVPLDETGKPESSFVNPAPAPAEPSEPTEDMRTTERLAQQVLRKNLSRMLTKETNAISDRANSADGFVQRVDEFYSRHATTLTDAVADAVTALANCGRKTDAAVFVAKWISDGKSAVLEASGRATSKDELTQCVRDVLQSATWTSRPERAIEELAEIGA